MIIQSNECTARSSHRNSACSERFVFLYNGYVQSIEVLGDLSSRTHARTQDSSIEKFGLVGFWRLVLNECDREEANQDEQGLHGVEHHETSHHPARRTRKTVQANRVTPAARLNRPSLMLHSLPLSAS